MAASEALSLGYGGVSTIRRASGLSRKAIAKGIREIAEGNAMPGRIRRLGAGRKSIVERDPKLLASLDRLIEPETRGESRISFALDLQEHSESGCSTDAAETSGQS